MRLADRERPIDRNQKKGTTDSTKKRQVEGRNNRHKDGSQKDQIAGRMNIQKESRTNRKKEGKAESWKE